MINLWRPSYCRFARLCVAHPQQNGLRSGRAASFASQPLCKVFLLESDTARELSTLEVHGSSTYRANRCCLLPLNAELGWAASRRNEDRNRAGEPTPIRTRMPPRIARFSPTQPQDSLTEERQEGSRERGAKVNLGRVLLATIRLFSLLLLLCVDEGMQCLHVCTMRLRITVMSVCWKHEERSIKWPRELPTSSAFLLQHAIRQFRRPSNNSSNQFKRLAVRIAL